MAVLQIILHFYAEIIYVISAVLSVRSITIQDLEHTDGSYRKVATIKDQVSKFVCLVFNSDSGRVSLSTYEMSKRCQ